MSHRFDNYFIFFSTPHVLDFAIIHLIFTQEVELYGKRQH